MPLQSIQAVAHPDGNRVDLNWRIDPAVPVDGVRVVRRSGRYPLHPDDGAVVVTTDMSTDTAFSDTGLKAGQVYYYSLFPYQGDPPVYQSDDDNRVMALVTAPNGYPEYMLGLLPAIYHRYDKDTQFLARFLQIVGGQFDQFHSLAEFNRRLRDVRHTPGPLLPLLAQWIGWRTDYNRQLDGQRDELRNAPAIYRRVGLMPTLEATIKRISNWESRGKEYVHNVFASNRPPRLNLWSMRRDAGGDWTDDETLQSLDYCYEGRPSIAADAQGVHWLFYHTERKGRWEIWSKTTPAITLDAALNSELVAGDLPLALWTAIDAAGLSLSQTSTLNSLGGNIWEIVDGPQRYVLEQLAENLRVYDVNTDEMVFSASVPQIVSDEINKYPSAALQGDTLWLFWSSYTTDGQWRVHYRRRDNARWTATDPQSDEKASNPFMEGMVYDAARQRRRAFAVNDDGGGLWLFWQEYNGAWQLRYNRHDGTQWGEPVTLPPDGMDDPRVQDDIMAVISPGAPDPRIYLFWARQHAIASTGEQRWQVALRVKDNQAPDAANWSSVHELPKAIVDNHHDREPYALLNAADELEVFWASSREDSGWSIWRSTLQDVATDTWEAAERITEPVYGQRAPLARLITDGLGLFYRGNRKRVYNSEIYRATEIHDDRYAGSLSLDVRHQQFVQLHEKFEDAQRYTYDTGVDGKRDDSNRIARDTVGAFLNADTLSEQEIHNGIARLREVVKEFMPMTDRAVFIPDKSLHTEYVYSYSLPPAGDSRYIVSTYSDDWISSLETSALGPEEDFDAVLES